MYIMADMANSPDRRDEIFYAFPSWAGGFDGEPYEEKSFNKREVVLTPPGWSPQIIVERTRDTVGTRTRIQQGTAIRYTVPDGFGILAYLKGTTVRVAYKRIPFMYEFSNTNEKGNRVNHSVNMTGREVRWIASPLMTKAERQSLPRTLASLPSHVL